MLHPVLMCDGRPGNFCVSGLSSVCPAGTWSGNNAVNCSLCPVGRYGALAGLTTANCSGLCPAGRFGSDAGMNSSNCSGACTAGYACPIGSSNSMAWMCQPGQYSVSGAGACVNCSAGRYGNASALSTASCTDVCPTGSYCPIGVDFPILCVVGTCHEVPEAASCGIGLWPLFS